MEIKIVYCIYVFVVLHLNQNIDFHLFSLISNENETFFLSYRIVFFIVHYTMDTGIGHLTEN